MTHAGRVITNMIGIPSNPVSISSATATRDIVVETQSAEYGPGPVSSSLTRRTGVKGEPAPYMDELLSALDIGLTHLAYAGPWSDAISVVLSCMCSYKSLRAPREVVYAFMSSRLCRSNHHVLRCAQGTVQLRSTVALWVHTRKNPCFMTYRCYRPPNHRA